MRYIIRLKDDSYVMHAIIVPNDSLEAQLIAYSVKDKALALKFKKKYMAAAVAKVCGAEVEEAE